MHYKTTYIDTVIMVIGYHISLQDTNERRIIIHQRGPPVIHLQMNIKITGYSDMGDYILNRGH